jgi:hypothetical protein
MNPDDVLDDVYVTPDVKVATLTSTYDPTSCHAMPTVGATVGGIMSISNGGIMPGGGFANTWIEDPLDKYAMNRFAVDHKVTAQELLKLQEVAPDYAKEIKDNIAKNLGRDIATKVSYTKKHDKDTDVHHFIGRVWVFSEEELKGILGIK